MWYEPRHAYCAALILPTRSFDPVGMVGGIAEMGLASYVPACYRSQTKEILGWADDYEDGGPRVQLRKFPLMYFYDNLLIPLEGDLEIPKGNLFSWVPAKYLRAFNLHDPDFQSVRGLGAAQAFCQRAKPQAQLIDLPAMPESNNTPNPEGSDPEDTGARFPVDHETGNSTESARDGHASEAHQDDEIEENPAGLRLGFQASPKETSGQHLPTTILASTPEESPASSPSVAVVQGPYPEEVQQGSMVVMDPERRSSAHDCCHRAQALPDPTEDSCRTPRAGCCAEENVGHQSNASPCDGEDQY